MPVAPVFIFIGGSKVLGGHPNTHLVTDGTARFQQVSHGAIFNHDAVGVVGAAGAPATTIGFTAPNIITDSGNGFGSLSEDDQIHVRNETDGTNQAYYSVGPSPAAGQITVKEGGIVTRAAGDNVTVALSGLTLYDATKSNTKFDDPTKWITSWGSDIALVFDRLQLAYPAGGDGFFLLKDTEDVAIFDGAANQWGKDGPQWLQFASAFECMKRSLAAWPNGPWTFDVVGFLLYQGDADIRDDQYPAFLTNAQTWMADLRDRFVEGPTFGSSKQTCPVVWVPPHVQSWSSKPGAAAIVGSAIARMSKEGVNVGAITQSDLELQVQQLPAEVGAPSTATAQHEIGRRLGDAYDDIANAVVPLPGVGDPTYAIVGQSQVNGTIPVSFLNDGGNPEHIGPQADVEVWNQNAQAWEVFNPLTNSSANGAALGVGWGIDVTLVQKLKLRHPGQTVRLIKFGWPSTSLGIDQNLANLVTANSKVKVDAGAGKFVLESGTWPVISGLVRFGNFGNDENNQWHQVLSASTTEIVVSPEFSSLKQEEADIATSASITIDPVARTYTLNAGTWANTPAAGQAITPSGFTDPNNNKRTTVVSATTTQIVVSNVQLSAETATASIDGPEVTGDYGRGTWDPKERCMFEFAAREVEKAKQALLATTGRQLDFLATIYYQFENDAEDANLAQAWQANLEEWIAAWRGRVATRSGNAQGIAIMEPFRFGSRPFANVDAMRQGARNIAASDSQVVVIPVDDHDPPIRPKEDEVHLTGRSQLKLGEVADQYLGDFPGIPSPGAAEAAEAAQESGGGESATPAAAESASSAATAAAASALEASLGVAPDVQTWTVNGKTVSRHSLADQIKFLQYQQHQEGLKETQAEME